MEALAALHGSALAGWLRTPEVYPFVNAGHILSLALLVGPIVTLDLRLLGAFKTVRLSDIAPPLSRVAMAGAVLTLLTGFLLFCVKPAGYWANAAFQMKLCLIVGGLTNAGLLQASARWRAALAAGDVSVRIKVAAGFSLAVWISAVLAGRWIAFVES